MEVKREENLAGEPSRLVLLEGYKERFLSFFIRLISGYPSEVGELVKIKNGN